MHRHYRVRRRNADGTEETLFDWGRWPMHPAAPVGADDHDWSVFREATRWCLFGVQAEGDPGVRSIIKGVNLIPEVMMAEVKRRFNLSYQVRGHGRLHGAVSSFQAAAKMSATAPPYGLKTWWHSHNMTAVSRWIDGLEAASRCRHAAATTCPPPTRTNKYKYK
jgi:hypothetical protein